jgi:hypothetical protein
VTGLPRGQRVTSEGCADVVGLLGLLVRLGRRHDPLPLPAALGQCVGVSEVDGGVAATPLRPNGRHMGFLLGLAGQPARRGCRRARVGGAVAA